MKRIFLIDGNSLANRAFYAMPYLVNYKKEPSGAVFGLANILIKLITEEKPDQIIFAFDHARKTFRNNLFDDYKAGRKETPQELRSQFPVIKELLDNMNIPYIEQEGIEADDIIGTLVEKIKDVDKVIISGDRDLLQLVNSNTQVWLTKKGLTELQKITEENLYDEFGVKKPSQIIELKALMGDSSDNIPGVPGVGEKTALKLIETYEDIDTLYERVDEIAGKLKDKLIEGKDSAYLSKILATIKRDCEFEVPTMKYKQPFDRKVYDFFKEWSFSSLLNRKDLFYEEIFETVERIKIEDISQIEQLKKKIGVEFAYNLDNMEFSANRKEIYYLEPTFTMFGNALSLEEVLTALKNIFEDAQVTKITYSAKNDMHVLDRVNIELKNFFDLDIANYILFAGVNNKKEKESVSKYFEERKNLERQIEKNELQKIFYDCEIPLVKVLFEMEKDGFQLDEAKLNEIHNQYSLDLKKLEEEIKDLAGEEFNINSPKQVSHIIFEKLGLTCYNNKKQSTSYDNLMEMIDQHEIVEKIIIYRKMSKIFTTYLEVYKKICQTKGNLIHTVFHQTKTNTGRLSSSDPNLQNIPTRDEDGKNIRKLFISKFAGGKIMSADYNQIELRLLAEMSDEEELIKAYQRGDDIHALTASQIFGVPIDKVTASQRREAKAVNFGIIYGISDYGLAQDIKTSRKRAKEYIDSYFLKYPKVKEFGDKNIVFARENGFVKTMFGRIRHIPEINASNYNIRLFAERVAMNMPLQGTASDIIKFAMIKIYDELKNMKSQLILQIHDELIIDVYPGEEEQVKKILVESMENIVKLRVKLLVSVGEGKSLYDCK